MRPSRHLVALLVALSACTPPSATGTSATLTPPAGALDPARPLDAREAAWIETTLAGLSLRERVGQMVMAWVLGDYTSNGDSSFAEVRRWISRDRIGGVVMSLGSPIEVAEKVNAMQRLSRVPLLVSSDLEPGLGRLEGGVFSHYLMDAGGATVFPNAMAIAATGRDEDAYDVGRIIAREARAVGIHINFAPTVDVNNNPGNPVINTRSFGEDPQRVARLTSAFVRGTQGEGVVATIKHFPGHGDTDVDSHVGLPVVSATRARLDSVELVPFAAGIRAGAGMVMTAHVALPAISGDSAPATLLPSVMTGLLRGDLKFTGLTITDALSMDGIGKGYSNEESAVLAVKAGSDILLKPNDPTIAMDAVVTAVTRGDISRARIDSSVRRILALKLRTGAIARPITSLDALREIVGAPAHRAMASEIATRAVTLVRDRGSLVPLAGEKIVVVQYMPDTELRAGRILSREIRSTFPNARVVKIGPNSAASDLEAIAVQARGADRIVLAAFVRRVEGEGRSAIPAPIAAWMERVATNEHAILVAFGNPYLLRQVPSASGYLITYGVGDALELAAARALLGKSPISGKLPVSLPGYFARGEGMNRGER